MSLQKEDKTMSFQVMGISETEGKKRIDFSMKRVAVLTLIFTNAYFLATLAAKLIYR